LSDIPGADSGEVYDQVGEMIRSRSVNRLIGVGDKISRYAADFPCRKEFFTSTDEFLRVFPTLKFADETILLKGARRFGFERISRLLIQKVHETVLEINLTALQNNLNHYKSLLPPNTRIMAMVKAFSYGSGSFEIANLLEFNKIDYLAVAYADEGVALRKAGVSLPLMVMSPDLKAFDTIIENNLEPEIYSLRILHEFSELLSLKGKKNYPVHIKLDTGMHRLGFMEDDLDELLKVISQTDYMRIQSIFSHLVASEDPSQDDFTRHQISLFRKLSGRIISALDYPVIRHILNTSGISRMPESAFDMVRLGIGLYGIDAALEDRSILQTVVSLKTTISQIKQVPAGDTVGYGRTGKMPEGGTIATVKIGYADGYSRRFGNGVGQMLVNGKKVKTVGRICMDMCMLDISGVDAEEGDEVVVFNDRIRVEDLAEQLGTIAYEVLTGISQRVKRVYYYE
jgi:alanine racemase